MNETGKRGGWGVTRFRRIYVGAAFYPNTVIGGPYPDPCGGKNLRWLVRCQCGSERIVPQPDIHQRHRCMECRLDRLKIDVDGAEMNVAEAASLLGLHQDTIRKRHHKGYDVADPPPKRSKFRAKYGKTLQELGDELGITREGVRQRIIKYGTPYTGSKR